MQQKYEFVDEHKNHHSYTGYAFIDEEGRCRIITWVEKRRDVLKRYLR